jgi:hypothetical protein
MEESEQNTILKFALLNGISSAGRIPVSLLHH